MTIETTFRCTYCWPAVTTPRLCDERAHCIYCGEDMHRLWPQNTYIIGCPVTDKFQRGGCAHYVTNREAPPVAVDPEAREAEMAK